VEIGHLGNEATGVSITLLGPFTCRGCTHAARARTLAAL
jgi:hypothetical protein